VIADRMKQACRPGEQPDKNPEKQVDFAVKKLNNRRRKGLNSRTAGHVFFQSEKMLLNGNLQITDFIR